MENNTNREHEYERLYKSYFVKFYNYGRRFTKDKYLVEDAIQEVFLDIWKRREKLKEINSPNSYYFSSLRNILFKKIKLAERTLHLADDNDEPEFNIEQKIISAEISNEQNQQLLEALQTLTSRQREAIFLRFYEGLSFEEVAEVLNITVKATYKIMARSLASLKTNINLPLALILLLLSRSGF